MASVRQEEFPTFEDQYDGRVMRQFINQLQRILSLDAVPKYKLVEVEADTYDVQRTDEIIGVNYTVTAAVDINLPDAAAFFKTNKTRILTICDQGGNASANNITVNAKGAQDINGASTYVISLDRESIDIYTNGANWFVK